MEAISSGVSFGAKVKNNCIRVAKRVKNETLPDFFRDRELFSHKKDVVDVDYFKYEFGDLDVHVNSHDPLYDMFDEDALRKYDMMA